MRAALVAIASAIALLAPPEQAADARGGFGFAARPAFHLGHFHRLQRFGRFGRSAQQYWWLPYDAWAPDAGLYPLDGGQAAPVFVFLPPPAPPPPPCIRTQEIMTVRAEEGGTRQVSVTRCRYGG